MDRFQTNNTLILTDFIHTLFSPMCRACCVSYLTLLMANIKNRRKFATDSNYLRCHGFTHSTWLSNGDYLFFSKQDTKERYWGQQLWQMEKHISVRPTEITRPVTVHHLQSWSRIFQSDQTEMDRFIWWTEPKFPEFWVEWNAPIMQLVANKPVVWYA